MAANHTRWQPCIGRCKVCGEPFVRRGSAHRFCSRCLKARDKERKLENLRHKRAADKAHRKGLEYVPESAIALLSKMRENEHLPSAGRPFADGSRA